MGMVVPTYRERLCQALGTVVTPQWHSCAKGVARARHQRPSLLSYRGGFSSTIIAIGRTHVIKEQQVPSYAYFPKDQVHIQVRLPQNNEAALHYKYDFSLQATYLFFLFLLFTDSTASVTTDLFSNLFV